MGDIDTGDTDACGGDTQNKESIIEIEKRKRIARERSRDKDTGDIDACGGDTQNKESIIEKERRKREKESEGKKQTVTPNMKLFIVQTKKEKEQVNQLSDKRNQRHRVKKEYMQERDRE